MEIATIGFTETTAADFFGRIAASGLPVLVDVRLNNTSQLAGFAKRDDLAYFLRELCKVDYVEEKRLATSHELMDDFRKKHIPWPEFEQRYAALLAERGVPGNLDRSVFERGAILLCSEAKPEHCHRRLAAEHLAAAWPDVHIRHL